MLFQAADIYELTTNIKLFHLIFISENIGGIVLTQTERSFLRSHGYDPYKNRGIPDYITYNFNFGQLESTLRGKMRLNKLSFDQYKDFLHTNKQHIPVRHADREAVNSIKKLAYDSIKRLSEDMQQDFAQQLAQANKTQRSYVERTVNKTVKGKPLNPNVVEKISADLAEKTRKWTYRFERIVNYAMHAAYQQGILSEIIRTYGINSKAYFAVRAGACEHCVRLYLRKDGTPKVFPIKLLISYGNNIGRKTWEWKATIYPLHPNCRCTLTIYPSKTGRDIRWNARTNTYERKFH